MARRATPYDIVFGDVAAERFPGIRTALEQAGTDPRDRDAFLMNREVVTLIRDLRPEEGIGEGIDQLAALVHHAYLFWEAGLPVVTIPPERLPELLGPEVEPPADAARLPSAVYAQFPEHRIWAGVVPDQPDEPLDGCFVHEGDRELRVLGIFGLRPDRLGFSVAEAAGQRPDRLRRPNGTALFSPTLSGGSAAGLHSLAGAEELLELGWRARWKA